MTTIDRGELGKVIERSTAQQPNYGNPGHGYQKPYHKRRKSFLEELFD